MPKNNVDELKILLQRMRFLHEVSQKISEKKALPKLLNEIMESSKIVMHAEASSLLLYDPENRKLYFQVATGEKGKIVRKHNVKLGAGIAGWVAKFKQPLLIEDCYKDSRFNPEYDRQTNFKTSSMICVPLIRKKQLLGVIQVINKVGGSIFTKDDLMIFETLASHCAIAIENAKLVANQIEAEALEREINTARDIQQALLPDKLPDYNDIDIAAKLIPAKQVGGDYYNIISVTKNTSLFLVADVTGKGIPAALIVSTIYSCLSTYLKMEKRKFDLMKLVSGLNRILIDSTTFDKFASCWFGLYRHDTGKLLSVNAGHNPPYIFKKGDHNPNELHKGGLFLGGLDVSYESEEVQLKKDDVLVFFSDGVTEAWNEQEEEYQEYRLIRVVQQHQDKSAGQILNAIEHDVRDHVGKAKQSDDFTCAVIKKL